MPEEIVVIDTKAVLAPFDEVRAAIERYKVENANLVFDYEDPKGNKEARNHVANLRKVKTQIGDIHKKAKAEALATGKTIDQEKRERIADVEEMIEVHATPIKAIEDRKIAEAAAKAEELRLERERKEEERLAAIQKKEDKLAAQQAELDAKEAELKAQQVEQERKEREKKIAEDAEREAKEQAAKQLIEAEERRKQELKEAEEKRIADIKTAEEKAKREQEEKEAAEKAEQERLTAIEHKRQANVEHRRQINNEVLVILMGYDMAEPVAKKLIEDIAKELFPTLTINY